MKYLFLVIGGIIFVSSLQAYREIGQSMYGLLGGIGFVAIFLLVQGFELKPIFLTGGQSDIFGGLSNLASGKQANIPKVDIEELLDAVAWALLGYAIDFIAGLFVWPIVSSWALVRIGGVTAGDISIVNLAKIGACVFLFQICIQQYLKRGGKLPAFITGVRNHAR